MEGHAALHRDEDVSVAGTKPSRLEGGAAAPSQTDEAFARAERLDGYRAVAVVLYALFLAYELTRTGSGSYPYEGTWLDMVLRSLQLPSVFFVLTGWLTFLPFARAALEPRAGALPWYLFSRRVLLVLPQYLITVIVVWIWRFEPTRDRWYDPLRHLSLTHIFSRENIFWPIGPSWVVATELWFCALIALLGAALLRFPRGLSHSGRRSLVIAIPSILLVVGIGYKWWANVVAEIPRDNFPVYLNPLANVDSLALGMLLAISFVDARYRPRFGQGAAFLLRALGLAGMVALIGLRWQHPTVDLYFHSLFAVAFVVLLASSVLRSSPSGLEGALGWWPLQGLGAISFSVLLFQEPLLSELAAHQLLVSPSAERLPSNVMVVLVLSILLATMVYWFFAYPAMQLSYLLTPKGSRTKRYPVEELGE